MPKVFAHSADNMKAWGDNTEEQQERGLGSRVLGEELATRKQAMDPVWRDGYFSKQSREINKMTEKNMFNILPERGS